MHRKLEQRLERLAGSARADLLCGGRKGVEKESLRVTADGHVSRLAHPHGLGSALTNRYITTDFSEALVEFVTPAFPALWETLQFLCDLHQFAYRQLDDELLWVTSMPCRVGDDESIPLAEYGPSNVGQMKKVYRRGLGYRYGRVMQTIAGVHFNYSLPEHFWGEYREQEGYRGKLRDFRSAQYFGLLRNFRREGWLLLYLFGASPAMCKSFLGQDRPSIPEFDPETLFEPYATSLRMSDFGYSNRTQSKLNIALNDLQSYVRDLDEAINTPEPSYERIGTLVDGVRRQLNSNILQIENEYYSPIRPKRTARSGERPTAALLRGGVEYVEVRALDLNPFDPVGVNQNELRFTECFLIYCLLDDSPPFDDAAIAEAKANHTRTAHSGRDPGLFLQRAGEPVLLADWARRILDAMAPVAELLDRGSDGTPYSDTLARQHELVEDADRTPSARLLAELVAAGTSFFEFALEAARSHKVYFETLKPVNDARQAEFAEEARLSHERQKELEAGETIDLEEHLARYYASAGI
ncbi:MAG: glutamate--cysteine ligase [Gammaproteobacteria bacterium]